MRTGRGIAALRHAVAAGFCGCIPEMNGEICVLDRFWAFPGISQPGKRRYTGPNLRK